MFADCRHIFYFSQKKRHVKRKKQVVQDLIPPLSIYIHMRTLYTYTNICICTHMYTHSSKRLRVYNTCHRGLVKQHNKFLTDQTRRQLRPGRSLVCAKVSLTHMQDKLGLSGCRSMKFTCVRKHPQALENLREVSESSLCLFF